MFFDKKNRKTSNRTKKKNVLILALFVIIIAGVIVTSCGIKERFIPKSISDLNSKKVKIGTVSGFIFEDMLNEFLPEAKVVTYKSREECFRALYNGSVDTVIDDEAVIRSVLRSMDDFELLDGQLAKYDYGLAFPKNSNGEKYSAEFNEYFSQLSEDDLNKLDFKWFGVQKENKKSEDIAELTGENGTVVVAVDEESVPFCYMSAGKPTGYNIDLLIGFCRMYGYKMDVRVVDFNRMLNGTESGVYDIGCASTTITESRKKRLIFSDGIYHDGAAFAVYSHSAANDQITEINAFYKFKQNFKRVFLEEKRYLLFGKGITVTILISLVSLLAGTIFGILLYVFSIRGIFLTRAVARFYVWVMQAVPPILIIFPVFYAYYKDLRAGGVMASIIGFILITGAEVAKAIDHSAKKVYLSEDEKKELAEHIFGDDYSNSDYEEYERYDSLSDLYRLEYIDAPLFFKKLIRSEDADAMYSYRRIASNLIKATTVVGIVSAPDMARVIELFRTASVSTALPIILTVVLYILFIKLVDRILDID